MIKCKQVNNPECGKNCCCGVCDEYQTCNSSSICNEVDENCPYAYEEENALAIMKTEAAGVIKIIADLTVQKKKIEEREKAMKESLKSAMEKYGVKSFETEAVKFMYVAPTVENRLDGGKLKKELPDVAAKYTKQNLKAGYVKVTVK